MSRRVNDSYESVMERLRMKVYRELGNGDGDQEDLAEFYVIHTFEDAVIARDEVSGKIYEVPYLNSGTDVYLGQAKEVENVYVQKRLEDVGLEFSNKEGNDVCELTGPIVMKNTAQRLAYAAVLVPGEPDHDGETVTKEKIEEAAHEWMQSYRNVDLQHTLNNVAVPVESYILPMDMAVEHMGIKMFLPQGTWVLASRVLDDTTWDKVEKGELTGYSVMGIRRTTLDAASKSVDMALKKTLLRDLGPDWVAAAVSIVDEPAVPKAKFFALKSKEEEPVEKSKTWYQKVKEILIPTVSEEASTKAGRRFSDDTFTKIQEAYNTLKVLMEDAQQERSGGDVGFTEHLQNSSKEKEGDEMKPEELKGLIDEAVKSALEPIKEELEALKSQEAEEETAIKEEEKVEEPVVNEEEEAFKSKVLEKLDELENKIGKKNTSSKSLKGQDGEEEPAKKSTVADRDAFGRKILEVE